MAVFLGMKAVESKKDALNLMRKSYRKKYPYYHESGEKSEISLKDFIERLIFVQCRKWLGVRIAFAGKQDPSGRQFLRNAIREHIMFLMNDKKLLCIIQKCAISFIHRKVFMLIGIYYETWKALLFAVETFFKNEPAFVWQWKESVCQMNEEIYGTLAAMPEHLTDILGYVCLTFQPSNSRMILNKTAVKNHTVIMQAMDRIRHYNYDHIFMEPMETYKKAYNDVSNIYTYCLNAIGSCEKDFCLSKEQFYEEIINQIKKEGYDADMIAYYYKDLIYEIELLYRNIYKDGIQTMPKALPFYELPIHELQDIVCRQVISKIRKLCQNRRKAASNLPNRIMAVKKRGLKDALPLCLISEKTAVAMAERLFSTEQEDNLYYYLMKSICFCQNRMHSLNDKLKVSGQRIPEICKTFQSSHRDRMAAERKMLASFFDQI